MRKVELPRGARLPLYAEVTQPARLRKISVEFDLPDGVCLDEISVNREALYRGVLLVKHLPLSAQVKDCREFHLSAAVAAGSHVRVTLRSFADVLQFVRVTATFEGKGRALFTVEMEKK